MIWDTRCGICGKRTYGPRAECTCPVPLVPTPAPTLGGGRTHVFVTRAALLAFQEAMKSLGASRSAFEETRRELTRLLLRATPVPGDRRRWTFTTGPGGPEYVAYVVPDGDLLLVADVRLAQDAPRAHIPSPPTDAPPTVRDYPPICVTSQEDDE